MAVKLRWLVSVAEKAKYSVVEGRFSGIAYLAEVEDE